jgi:hypothetical protein
MSGQGTEAYLKMNGQRRRFWWCRQVHVACRWVKGSGASGLEGCWRRGPARAHGHVRGCRPGACSGGGSTAAASLPPWPDPQPAASFKGDKGPPQGRPGCAGASVHAVKPRSCWSNVRDLRPGAPPVPPHLLARMRVWAFSPGVGVCPGALCNLRGHGWWMSMLGSAERAGPVCRASRWG